MKITKNNKKLLENIDSSVVYEPIEAIKILKSNSYTKFEEALEVAINLGIDTNKTDQNVRGVITLPKGNGKTVKIAVLAKGEKQTEAKEAGADLVGGDELIEKIKQGDLNFEKLISTTKMMIKLSKLGKILGPKGLMPNPKLGSVTDEIKKAVINAKSGQVEIKNDKDGNIGVSIGKKSFTDDKLIKNYNAIIETLEKEKSNNTVKGDLVKNVFITSTMGVSYKIKLAKGI